MVIVFTYLAKGNAPMALVFVAINSVAQMLLIPVYARLLIGDVDFDVLVVGESVLLYLGLPLLAGVLTRDGSSCGAAARRPWSGSSRASTRSRSWACSSRSSSCSRSRATSSSSARASSSRWPSP